ncbi:hypothetical protein, partial [Pasteurella atlantica]|uniref:hypothetical protein n=1 Tax=Pasteurella atlantica TaxID=2827233 RepID=UPI002761F58D
LFYREKRNLQLILRFKQNTIKSIRYVIISAVSTVTELDKDGDGTPEKVIEVFENQEFTGTLFAADKNSHCSKVTLTKIDEDQNGVFEVIEEKIYDAPSTTTTTYKYTDSDQDGQLDYILRTSEGRYNIKNSIGGNIKHNSDNTTTVHYSQNVDDHKKEEIITLDENGLMTKSDLYMDGKETYSRSYEYDSATNKLVKSESLNVNSGNTTTNLYEYENDLGHVSKNIWSYSNSDKVYFKERYYSEEGCVWNESRGDLDGDGKIETIVRDTLDADYNILREAYLDLEGNLLSYQDRTYDDHRRIITSKTDGNNNNVYEDITEYTYDNLANIKSSELASYDINEDGNLDKFNYRVFNVVGKVLTEEGVYDLNGENPEVKKIYYLQDSEVVFKDNFSVENIYFYGNNDVSVTLSDEVLDKLANDDNNHSIFVDSYNNLTGSKLKLDGSFTKTAETEAHDGQDFVKYTDEAGNALIVDPDITVDII